MSKPERYTTRIKYIEPTNVEFFTNGTKAIVPSNDLMLNPLEELCIAVDLEVIIPNRKACSLAKENGEYIKLNYSSTNGTLSFLHGTSGMLTTNFTDVNLTNPSENTAECLGIESISIEYNSWMYPQVTIKFVDTRGASVMLPEEDSYANGTGAGSVYRALFSLPSPTFILKVKGFYGKGATFYLAEQNVDIDLDSSSGNFVITAKFIGMMYRIFTDLPMVFICSAPYMDGGDKYWQSKIDEGKFVFYNKDNTKSKMYKFPELRKRIADAAYSGKRISAAARNEQMIDNNNQKIEELKNIRDTFPIKDWYEGKNGYYLVSNKTEKEIRDEIKAYTSRVKNFDETYHTNFLETIAPLARYGEKIDERNYKLDIKAYDIKWNEDPNKIEIVKTTTVLWTDFEDKIEIVEDEAKKYIQTRAVEVSAESGGVNGANKGAKLYIFLNDGIKNCTKFIREGVEHEIEKFEAEREEATAKFKAQEDAALQEALGFTPSIENMYRLAFAHMDTFMHMFFEHMKNIKDKLNANDPSRMVNGFDIVNSDIKRGEVYIPPYPAFYTDKKSSGEDRKQLVWPEEVSGGENFDEVLFVKNLLRASSMYADESVKAEEYAELMRQNYASGGTFKTGGNGESDYITDAPSIMITDFVPVTTHDFVYKDEVGNPYSWIKRLDEDKMILSSEIFEDDVIGTFALRAIHYLSTNKDSGKEARTFGELDAINFIKAFGTEYFSDRFYSFISKYADNRENQRREATDSINGLLTESPMWNYGNKRLLAYTGNNSVVFDLFGAGSSHLFPIGEHSLKDMQSDFADGSALFKKEYIDERGLLENDNETFFVFHSRDYISELYKQVERLPDEGYKSLSKADIKRFRNNLDVKEDKDEDVSYRPGCIYEINEKGEEKLSQNEILNLLNESSTNKQKYFVKYPTYVDEKRKDSLFDEPFYIGQGSYGDTAATLARAYLFLSAIPIRRRAGRNYGTCNIPTSCENGVELKSILLREGSFYWRESYMNKHGGEDPIKTDVTIYENGKKVSYKYEKASIDEAYMVGRGAGYTNSDSNKYETVRMLTDKDKKRAVYLTYTVPAGITLSRKRVLANEFERWALDEFKKVEKILENKEYYENPEKNGYKKGLSGEEVTNDGSKFSNNYIDLMDFLKDTFFDVWTIFDYYAGTEHNGFSADRNHLINAVNGFMDGLESAYKDIARKSRNDAQYDIEVAKVDDPFNNNDIRLSTYMVLKNLYDKWLVAPYKGKDTWTLGSPDSDFECFAYIDSFYHKIGRSLNVNITKVGEWLSSCMPSQNIETSEGIMLYMGKSVYEYLTSTAEHTGGILIAFPQMIGGISADYLSDMFKALPFNSDWDTDRSSFVFLYTYKPSEHLGNDEYDDDGFDLDNEQVTSLLADDGYDIPAFGVTYAKQNQSFFKNITLNTSSPAVTEASITATLAIAAKGSEGVRETSLFGQDLYRIKTSYSYKCEFDMMGCIQVMPLMYFQLNNVPFWRGGYQILKVTHEIKAGDMTTHVVGQRINKYSIPLTDGTIINSKDVLYADSGSFRDTPRFNGDAPDFASENNINGNPNYKTDEIDFDESNITEQKPIICLTPAHGPQTSKGSEWYWSSKLIDDYIIKKLKKINFYDGTSYSKNIQRCNKTYVDGGKTLARHTGSGYSSQEVRALINKYGSKNVISIVPHWNGGGGNYFCAFDGKQVCGQKTYQNGRTWWDFDNCGTKKMRADSYVLGEIFREEADKLSDRANNDEFNEMPIGFMKGKSNRTSGSHLLPAKSFDDGTDWASSLDCACVLTENFFADYKSDKNKKADIIAGTLDKIDKNSDYYNEKDGNRFIFGEGWLLSDEGMNAIADMHVEAIRRYINNLREGGAQNAAIEATNIEEEKSEKAKASYLNDFSDELYQRFASQIGVSSAALKTIRAVEIGRNGNAFVSERKPAILFEGSIFWKLLKDAGKNPAKYAKGNEDVIYERYNSKYYKYGEAEYDRKQKAIDAVYDVLPSEVSTIEKIALESCSFGAFQILGINYAQCGCEDIYGFNFMMETNEGQFEAVINYIGNDTEMLNSIADGITPDWKTFAKRYNAGQCQIGRFETSLRTEYERITGGK